MAVIDGTEFYVSRMAGCSIRWWIQGIVVLLLVARGEFSTPAATNAAAAKCELARTEFRNRGLETLLAGFPDNVTNGECFVLTGICFYLLRQRLLQWQVSIPDTGNCFFQFFVARRKTDVKQLIDHTACLNKIKKLIENQNRFKKIFKSVEVDLTTGFPLSKMQTWKWHQCLAFVVF